MTVIYWTNVTGLLNNAAFDAAMKKVSPQRCEKVNRLKHQSDKNLSLGAGLVLEYALKKFSNNCKDTSIAFGKNGKPCLKENQNVHFSLSHSGDIAICAVSDFPIGIDTQLCTDFKEEICARYFKKCEADFVFAGKTPCDRKDRFFKMWTLKEAYAKMTGRGLGQFGDFEIDLKDGISAKKDGQILPLSFFEFDIKGYKTSLCVCGKEKDTVFKNINICDLLIN